ncbi:MAG: hypothetical protein ABSF28_06055 [Terracidiphilus sp.]|jgi:hypothetical protein
MIDIADAVKSLFDSWYKAFTFLGAGVLVASLFYPVHGVTSQQAQFLSSGAFLIGLGEWKNHRWCISYYRTCRITELVRMPDRVGVFCDVGGFVLILWGIWRVVHG